MTNMKSLRESLEGLLESGWQLPMSGGKIMVNAKEFKSIVEEMKNSLPEEIIQAKTGGVITTPPFLLKRETSGNRG